MAKTSATKRLLGVLRSIQSVSGTGSQQTVGEVLAPILGIKTDAAGDIQAAYSKILKLIDASRDEVAAHYYDPDLAKDDQAHVVQSALQPLDEVRGVVVANSIHSKVGVLGQFQLRPIEILALTVTKDSSERDLEDQDLARAKAQLESALKTILASQLDRRFKSGFSHLIHQAQLSLDHYRIFGSDGVAEAVGIIFARSVGFQATAAPSDVSTVGSVLQRVSSVLTIVYRGAQIARYFLAPGTPSDGLSDQDPSAM